MTVVGTDPVYELIIKYSRSGARGYNVLYYLADSSPGGTTGSEELNNAFESVVEPTIRVPLPTAWTIETYTTRRLNNITDFSTMDVSLAGLDASQTAPDFVSVRINKIRTDKSTRSGWVLMCPPTEDSYDGNALTAAGITEYGDIATDLLANIGSGGITYNPVIVGGKSPLGVPAAESAWIYNAIASTSLTTTIRSAVGRKL